MIVDSSAVIAVLLDEPEADAFVAALSAQTPSMSVATWVECHVVVDRRAPHLLADLEDVLTQLDPSLVELTVAQARTAREAHRRYGVRSGSPAHLNFGDCFAYALAITTGDTLLFKGDDFTHTDVRPALAQSAG